MNQPQEKLEYKKKGPRKDEPRESLFVVILQLS